MVVASFAYTFIEFYDSAIPGVGYSFKDFITVGATMLQTSSARTINQMIKTITDMQTAGCEL